MTWVWKTQFTVVTKAFSFSNRFSNSTTEQFNVKCKLKKKKKNIAIFPLNKHTTKCKVIYSYVVSRWG